MQKVLCVKWQVYVVRHVLKEYAKSVVLGDDDPRANSTVTVIKTRRQGHDKEETAHSDNLESRKEETGTGLVQNDHLRTVCQALF